MSLADLRVVTSSIDAGDRVSAAVARSETASLLSFMSKQSQSCKTAAISWVLVAQLQKRLCCGRIDFRARARARARAVLCGSVR